MLDSTSLSRYLNIWVESEINREGSAQRDIAATIECIAKASIILATKIAHNSFAIVDSAEAALNADGDTQKPLDMLAHQLFVDALGDAPVALLASEESDEAILLNVQAALGVAIDPLDGSSNIDTNLSIGTIFSISSFDPAILPVTRDSFLKISGREQVAAGFIVYGPQTTLVLSCKNGTQLFVLDRDRSEFLLVRENITIPAAKREFAINASNYHYWDNSVRGYVDDCIAGQAGPRGEDFNMRWAASLVAEAFRIFVRGGIFLYPRDTRPNYENGRLRLLYEAFPIALLVEQAGGAATDGETPILDKTPGQLHERVPLVFGSTDKVDRVKRYYINPPVSETRYALFGSRSILRN